MPRLIELPAGSKLHLLFLLGEGREERKTGREMGVMQGRKVRALLSACRLHPGPGCPVTAALAGDLEGRVMS